MTKEDGEIDDKATGTWLRNSVSQTLHLSFIAIFYT